MKFRERMQALDRIIFGDPDTLPRHLARAVIREYDTSNRTGDVRLGTFRGTLHGYPPSYRRSYQFELPVWRGRLQYPFFLAEEAGHKSTDPALVAFGDYLTGETNGQITWALLSKYVLDVAITQEADANWQRQHPTEFYDKVIEFYRRMHPPIAECVVVRSGSTYDPGLSG